MKIVDLNVQIDGLILDDDETIDDFIDKISELTNSEYEITYEIQHEEEYD